MSRRGFFANLLPARLVRRIGEGVQGGRVLAREGRPAPGEQVAVVAARHCLVSEGQVCTACAKSCPVKGALTWEGGLPMVNPALCTGCELCHEACPAPTKAILLRPRPAGLPPLG